MKQRQKAEVCQRLLELGGAFGRAWTVEGPVWDMVSGKISSGEWTEGTEKHLLARLALDIWHNERNVSALELVDLGPRTMTAVAELIGTGFKPSLVALWLRDHDPRQMGFSEYAAVDV